MVKKLNRSLSKKIVVGVVILLTIITLAYLKSQSPKITNSSDYWKATVVPHDQNVTEKYVIENVFNSSDKKYYSFGASLKTDNFARGQYYWGPTSTPGLIKKTGKGWELIAALQNWFPCQKLHEWGMTDADITALHFSQQGTQNGVAYCQ